MKDSNNIWHKHLDEMDQFYSADKFFNNKNSIKKSSIHDNFADTRLFNKLEELEEGQLNIDILQDKDNLYIITPVAGTNSQDIEISLEKDVLHIHGKRDIQLDTTDKEFLFKECFWGKFSRSIILPIPVQANKIEATKENHILIIKLPKADEAKKIEIKIKK